MPLTNVPRPCSREMRPEWAKSRERLLHSAHAHAMNSGQFLLGGQLVALAQCARFMLATIVFEICESFVMTAPQRLRSKPTDRASPSRRAPRSQ